MSRALGDMKGESRAPMQRFVCGGIPDPVKALHCVAANRVCEWEGVGGGHDLG